MKNNKMGSILEGLKHKRESVINECSDSKDACDCAGSSTPVIVPPSPNDLRDYLQQYKYRSETVTRTDGTVGTLFRLEGCDNSSVTVEAINGILRVTDAMGKSFDLNDYEGLGAYLGTVKLASDMSNGANPNTLPPYEA